MAASERCLRFGLFPTHHETGNEPTSMMISPQQLAFGLHNNWHLALCFAFNAAYMRLVTTLQLHWQLRVASEHVVSGRVPLSVVGNVEGGVLKGAWPARELSPVTFV
jgi:hypothetical protein